MKNLETPGKTGRVGRYVKTRLFIPQNVTLPLTCSCYQISQGQRQKYNSFREGTGHYKLTSHVEDFVCLCDHLHRTTFFS